MAVLALMYHRTPKEAGHILDVAMPVFRAQMQALQAAGVRFICFGEALDRRWYGGDTVVSITFDDGHESNLEAMAFLYDAGIPCTSFFVSDYVRLGQQGFMDPAMFKAASAFCEVGAHGASHTALTALGPDALEAELSVSKAYLEALCGAPVTALSAPGGKINRRVVRAAVKLGFEVVGDSESLLNTAPSLPLHRVCMLNGQSPEHVLSLVRAGRLYWLTKRLRRVAVAMAARSLGDKRLETLKRTFKGDRSHVSL
jgi:peptidoglycan/xylan/chitin deacetylase (PgdA/CDA1 family)